MFLCVQMPPRVFSSLDTVTVSYKIGITLKLEGFCKNLLFFLPLYNLKSASSSLEPPIFTDFPNLCKHKHTRTHTQTDTLCDYRTLPPMLRGKGNKLIGDTGCLLHDNIIIIFIMSYISY